MNLRCSSVPNGASSGATGSRFGAVSHFGESDECPRAQTKTNNSIVIKLWRRADAAKKNKSIRSSSTLEALYFGTPFRGNETSLNQSFSIELETETINKTADTIRNVRGTHVNRCEGGEGIPKCLFPVRCILNRSSTASPAIHYAKRSHACIEYVYAR